MADHDLGFDPITGSPLLSQEYGALQGRQLSQFGLQDSPTGPFGALARIIAAGRGTALTQDALGQISAAHQEALPALARAYSTPDPIAAIANDRAAPAFAKWAIINQSPEQVAATKLRLASAGLVGQQEQLLEPQVAIERARLPVVLRGLSGELARQGGSPSGGAAASGAAPAGGEPAASAAAPFLFPGRVTPAAAPGSAAAAPVVPGTPATADPLADPQGVPPEQRQELLNRLGSDPAALFRLRQKLQLQKLQQQAVSGGRAG